jgi:hypothetical protein
MWQDSRRRGSDGYIWGNTATTPPIICPLGMTPFRALYSYDPLSFVEISFGDNRAPMVQDWVQQSQDILGELKDHLQRAQNQQKVQAR